MKVNISLVEGKCYQSGTKGRNSKTQFWEEKRKPWKLGYE